MVRCGFCGFSLKGVFVNRWEGRIVPPRRVDVCMGCHTKLRVLPVGVVQPLSSEMLDGFKHCGSAACLICRLGLEEFCRLVARLVLRGWGR